MSDSFLLSRVLLQFGEPSGVIIANLSAATITPDGSLWVGSDEFAALERLQQLDNYIYGNQQAFDVGGFIG